MSDFEAALENWKESQKTVVKKPYVYVPPPKVDLTLGQKQVIVGYMLGGVSKGIFEDCPEFWEGVSDIDGSYRSYYQAAEEFLEELKNKILKELV